MNTRWVAWITLFAFCVYCLWIAGPFVRSVFVRDAALTAWSRVVVAPIAGRIDHSIPRIGTIVPADGAVTAISNPLLLSEVQALDRTVDRIKEFTSAIAEGEEFLEELKSLEANRTAELGRISSLFQRQLETDVLNLEQELSVSSRRLEVLKQNTDRQRNLSSQGVGSKVSIEESLLRVAEAELLEARLKARLAHTRLRQQATKTGVFITRDGNTPSWLRYSQLELDLEIRKVLHELHRSRRLLRAAKSDYEKEAKIYEKLKAAKISAPAGAVIVAVSVHPGQTVRAGDTVATWVNCDEILVDVPVSDAELPLIRPGMEATVIVEGEASARTGTVDLTRGSAATIGADQLAATAKGRNDGEAQVLVSLGKRPVATGECPIGRAAFVEFPGVGLLDVIRARLRL